MRYGNLKIAMNVQNNGSILNRLIQTKILSPQSVAALKVALDGWHDTTIGDFAGIPDRHVGKLFTFDDVAEISITKTSSPVALPAGPWACRIAANPFSSRTTLKPGACRGSMTTMDNSAPLSVTSNVLVSYTQDGTDFADVGVGGVSENTQLMSMSPEFLTSKLTLAGCAIEVVNTTPTLTVGGLVTACNVPQPSDASSYTTNVGISAGAGSGTMYPVPVRMVNTFPKNLTEMVKYSPFQDKAKDGCYINARMQFTPDMKQCVPKAPLIFTEDLKSNAGANPNVPVYLPQQNIIPAGASSLSGYGDAMNWYDMDSPVIMLTNLPDTTTLTIRVRWFAQIVPDEDNNVFLRAAHPSPIYDPNFFEIYSRTCALIPAACSFTMNPSGEWWKAILGGIARAAGPLLIRIPHPIAKAAGVALTGAGSFLEDSEKESASRRREKNRNDYYGKGNRKDVYGQIVDTRTGKPIKQKQKKNKGKGIPNAAPKGSKKG